MFGTNEATMCPTTAAATRTQAVRKIGEHGFGSLASFVHSSVLHTTATHGAEWISFSPIQGKVLFSQALVLTSVCDSSGNQAQVLLMVDW